MDARLPAHIEVSGLLRAVSAAGGFATVLATGERDAGTLLIVCCANGGLATAYERMPQPDGSRKWTVARRQNADNPKEFQEYCARRKQQDSDLWLLELDIPNAERFIESSGTAN